MVEFVEPLAPVPVSVDSSNIEIIEAGLAACRSQAGTPMLNSASLERVEALDVAQAGGHPVIATAAGESGMPQNDEQRVANASRMVDAAVEKGIPLSNIYVDGLVFPISVDGEFCNHYFNAVRELRQKYGPEIHITGGFSNVSFGLPSRRLINDAFANLAVDAGADSGIVDPVTGKMNEVFSIDKTTARYKLAEDMLLGRDRFCKKFLRAYRKGELQPAKENERNLLAMAIYQVLYWKDIPAQVKVSEEGRRPVSRPLPGYFQEEIDRVAMEEGLAGTDDYLNQWQWSAKQERPGSVQEVLDALVSELEQQWSGIGGKE